jgi:hypothetical protein
MRKHNEPMKALSFSIPLALADKIDDSAQHNRRSFTQEVVWRLEQSVKVDFVVQEKTPDQVAARSGAVKASSL